MLVIFLPTRCHKNLERCTFTVNEKLMNLPENFVAQMQHILGAEYLTFAESLEQERPTSIRLNPRKKITNDILFGQDTEPVKYGAKIIARKYNL